MQNKKKLRALNLNVVVTPVVLENKTIGGFDLTGYVDENEHQVAGVVVVQGERCPTDVNGKFTLKEGSVVIYNKHKATSVTLDGELYSIISYLDLILTF